MRTTPSERRPRAEPLPRVVPFLLMSIGPIMTILLLPVVLVLYAGFWSYEWARTRAFGATRGR
jgi:hypothetical protein